VCVQGANTLAHFTTACDEERKLYNVGSSSQNDLSCDSGYDQVPMLKNIFLPLSLILPDNRLDRLSLASHSNLV